MKVLHVQKVNGIGGSERHLLTILPRLADSGVEVRVGVLATGDASRFISELARVGVEAKAWSAGPDLNPVAVAHLTADVRRFRPDLVHTHLIHGDLHGQLAARACSVPGVSTVHGVPAFYRRQPYRSVGRLVGRMARRRIAISEHVAAFLRELDLAPHDRIEVIPYGVDTSGWQLPTAARESARSELAVEASVVVGIASRLIPGKGHDSLIDAFASASRHIPGLRLVVAGDGPLRDELETRAARVCPEGAITFLGFVDDVPRFMAACDMVVFPTTPELGEGFGLAALEAMAAGRPVIVTRVAALPEVVSDGETGIVVAPASTDELATAITVLAQDADLRTAMGAAGRRRAQDSFGVTRMVDRTIALYESVLSTT